MVWPPNVMLLYSCQVSVISSFLQEGVISPLPNPPPFSSGLGTGIGGVANFAYCSAIACLARDVRYAVVLKLRFFLLRLDLVWPLYIFA